MLLIMPLIPPLLKYEENILSILGSPKIIETGKVVNLFNDFKRDREFNNKFNFTPIELIALEQFENELLVQLNALDEIES